MGTPKKSVQSVPNPDEEATAPEAETVAQTVARDEALRQTYADAQKKIREENLDRFNQLRVEGMKALGYDWTPPDTDEQKAAKQIEELLAANPGLAEIYRKQAEDAAAAADAG